MIIPCRLYHQNGYKIMGVLADTIERYEFMKKQGFIEGSELKRDKEKEIIKFLPFETVFDKSTMEEIEKENQLEPEPVDNDELDLMSKEQLVFYARETKGLELKVRDTKVSLIKAIKES